MNILRRVFATLTVALSCAAASAVAEYPDKPVKIIVPYPPEGTMDILARLIAQRLAERLKQPFVNIAHIPYKGAGPMLIQPSQRVAFRDTSCRLGSGCSRLRPRPSLSGKSARYVGCGGGWKRDDGSRTEGHRESYGTPKGA